MEKKSVANPIYWHDSKMSWASSWYGPCHLAPRGTWVVCMTSTHASFKTVWIPNTVVITFLHVRSGQQFGFEWESKEMVAEPVWKGFEFDLSENIRKEYCVLGDKAFCYQSYPTECREISHSELK